MPLLDEEFSKQIELRHKTPDADFLNEDFEKEVARFREAKRRAGQATADTDDVEKSPLMGEVAEGIAAARLDPDAAAKCERDLLKLKREFDKAADRFQWPAVKAEAYDWLSYLRKIADEHGTEEQRQRADEFSTETEDAVHAKDAEKPRKVIAGMTRLYFQIASMQPSFWIYHFQQAEKQQTKMADAERAARLLAQGREYQARNNLPGLQNVIRQLWDLLPADVVERAERGYGAGLVR